MSWLFDKRTEKNLTQEQVSRRIGISRAAYANIENGARNPSVAVAKRLGKTLGVKWTKFFEE